MKPNVVVIGSLNADFVIRTDRFPVPGETIVGTEFQMFPGGKGANQAYAAAKLGARTSMIGRVGDDNQGEFLKKNLASVGVDIQKVVADASVSTGVATITINQEGQNQIIIVPGANGRFNPAQLEGSKLSSGTIVLLQLEIPLDTVFAAATLAKSAGATVILDPAPARPLPDDLLSLADYLTPNESELAILSGIHPRQLSKSDAVGLAQNLVKIGAKKVLAKLGSAGALLVDGQTEQFWPAIPVQAIDTTAAGDAFNGAFAAGLARGISEEEAGKFATVAAAISVTRSGAQPSMPSLSEVEAFLRTKEC